MRYLVWIPAITILLSIGCSGGDAGTPIGPDPNNSKDPALNLADTFLNDVELRGSPPEVPVSGDYKWYPDILRPYEEVIEGFYLTSTNGVQIRVHVHRPDIASPESPCQAIVLIPGGRQNGKAWHAKWRKCNTRNWAKTGFITVDFDCQGRGESGGVEDWDGPVHREDLRTVIEYTAGRDDVLNNVVGVVSSSWGITLASSTLAIYQDLPVRFLIDLEGQQDRYTSTNWDDPFWIDYRGGIDTSDDEFWAEREAITFQPFITVPYIRVQSGLDHIFDRFYVDHAIELVNAAVNGLSPYARLNHEEPNLILDIENPHQYGWEDIDTVDEALYMYVVEASVTVFPGEEE